MSIYVLSGENGVGFLQHRLERERRSVVMVSFLHRMFCFYLKLTIVPIYVDYLDCFFILLVFQVCFLEVLRQPLFEMFLCS